MKICYLRFGMMAAVALSFVSLVYAGPKDFWERKPFTQWTLKEVETLLLTESPWTRTHEFPGWSYPGELREVFRANAKGGRTVTLERPTEPGGLVIINWFSRPVREATVRQWMLRYPAVPKGQLDEILNRNPNFVELLVTDLPQNRANWVGDREAEIAKFKESTFLMTKSVGKVPIANMIKAQGWGDALILQFAREMNGKATVTAEDQEASLSIRIGGSIQRFTFKLADMMVRGKLEF